MNWTRVGSLTVVASLCAALTGCGANLTQPAGVPGAALHGNVHGGQQPVSGATVGLYAAGTGGYGAGALSLLTTPVVSNANGNFTITGDYTCPSSTSQLYIIGTGGNPGLPAGTNNPALALMAALGPCGLYGGQYTLNPNSFFTVNEVTTVAAVYALHSFMSIGSSQVGTTSGNAVGLANSFQLVNNLVNPTTGVALATTPVGNGTAPQATLNTLANILATCVNSTGTDSNCSNLFTYSTLAGFNPPTDTIQAIYNIAFRPANNLSALFSQQTAGAPFQPTLSATPNDWSLAVVYAPANMGASYMAIDAAGDIWLTNSPATGTYNVVKLANNGQILSGASGFTSSALTSGRGIAIDPAGNAWVIGYKNTNVVEFSSSGAVLSGSGYPISSIQYPYSIAIDGQGSAWIVDATGASLFKMNSSGAVVSNAAGWTAPGSTQPSAVAIDNAGDAWVASGFDDTVVEFANNGTVLSGAKGFATPGIAPLGIAFDSSGNAWTNSFQAANSEYTVPIVIAELNPSGTVLSPAGGYSTCTFKNVPENILGCFYYNGSVLAVDGAGSVWNLVTNTDYGFHNSGAYFTTSGVTETASNGVLLSGSFGLDGGLTFGPSAIAVDGSGNLWGLTYTKLVQYVGLAAPLVTPFSVGVQNHTVGQMP